MIMKKLILSIALIGIGFEVNAQWNPNGNNSTTGTVSASQFQMTSEDGKTGFYLQRPTLSTDPFKITMGSQTIAGGLMIGREDWNSKVMVPWDLIVGSRTPDAGFKFTVKGKISAREIKVTATAGGADFVFAKDYDLPSLDFVERYIRENKHLPEIASAKEMKESGLLLGEMNIKLLQKIEELTLYTIAQQKEIESLKSLEDKLEILQAEIERLKKKN